MHRKSYSASSCIESLIHASALVDCPALQHPRRCEYFEENTAGKMVVNIAAAFELIFTTGRKLWLSHGI